MAAPKKAEPSETNEVAEDKTKIKKAPQVKAKKEYLGPKVEGEDF